MASLSEEKKKIGISGMLFLGILFFTLLLIAFVMNWGLKICANLTMEETVYTLTSSLEGTDGGMIFDFAVSCIVPAAVLTLAVIIMTILIYQKKGRTYYLRLIGLSCALLFFGVSFVNFWSEVDMGTYIKNQMATDAVFVEEQYVDPLDVEIEFPKEKRNLIFIYLESMETTYADEENGGGFAFNCIPELTSLAQEHEDFSGNSKTLNGGHVLTGSTWTMGALLAQTSGIPLQVSIDVNSMGTQEHFFEGMANLGDILELEGYSQTLMIGSEAEFGGRKLFFEEHGNYQIKDYYYAIDTSLISEGYKVSWGYEDGKLFEFAKAEILQMAEGDNPFNFTILTVDTHFEDGYLCEDCQNSFPGNQYANVMACSSRKVSEFVSWIQEQDFYENTTIVLSGDHLTMDSDFCNEVSDDYARKTYTCIINPGCENEQKDKKREYTTMDIFPTTLASLGVTIEGDRLGLGTNLFSETPTLCEEYGLFHVNGEVAKKSDFLIAMASIDTTTDAYLKSVGAYPTALVQAENAEDGILSLTVSEIANLDTLTRVELDVWEIGKEDAKQTIRLKRKKGNYVTELNVKEYSNRSLGTAIYVVDNEKRRYQVGELPGDLELYTNDFGEYLTVLMEKEYAVFLAVMDEAATALTASGRQKLKSLGLEVDLRGQIHSSYYAVLDGKQVLCENISQDRIGEDGVLLDGKTKYSIMSSGFNSGPDCSIRIAGQECAIDKRGINIVVYDTKTERVIDSVCFDTHSGNYVTRSTGTVEINFSQGKKIEYVPDAELQAADFCDYLHKVKEKESYVLFVAIKDEGTYGLTEEMKQALKNLGVKTDLTGQYRMSYYAVVDGDLVQEQLGTGVLEMQGVLSDGIIYEICSEGYFNEEGARGSIKLEGVEYAVNSRGMNFVVYDKERGCVVDAVAFDTYEEATPLRK